MGKKIVTKAKIISTGISLTAAYSLYATRTKTEAELINLAASLDAKKFGGWFSQNGVSNAAIAAMWLTESAGDPRATNFTGGDGAQGGSWGLGQVTALTATDYGLPRALAPLMLYPNIGGKVSMSHVKAVVTGLRRAGLAGDHVEWVQAYNVGLTGFINGRRNVAHYNRFILNLA